MPTNIITIVPNRSTSSSISNLIATNYYSSFLFDAIIITIIVMIDMFVTSYLIFR